MQQVRGSLWGDLRASCKFWGFCCHERGVDQPWVLEKGHMEGWFSLLK